LEEVGFKLGFAVLLTIDEAFLADDCSIVVARVAAWMSEIAPWKKLVMFEGIEAANASKSMISTYS
jgi:hypothetical protein